MGMNKSQSENIELQAMRAIHQSASDKLKASLGLSFEQISGVVCSASSVEPSILLNRCFVTDDNALTDLSAIKAVKAFYADAGVSRFFLHVVDSNEDTRRTLKQAGMMKARGWMKFIRDASPAVTRNPELDIRKIGPEHAKDFARIVAPCFDMTEASVPLVAGMVHHPQWHLYMGFDGDKPAATGAIFFQHGAAHCDWGSTHSDFRRRGFQGAMLARRINDAIEMGATRLFTETGEAVPDDPQHSYNNIMRYGFVEDYLRENWVPDSNNVA
jgi:hypothetical protein